MSIIETMARAIAIATRQSLSESGYGGEDLPLPPEDIDLSKSYALEARAALRAIRPEDVSDGMVHEFYRIDRERLPYEDWMERARRAIAAAIAAGAEQ